MAWRSVVITHPASLSFKQRAMQVEQNGDTLCVPLEDISVLVIDQPQVSLTAQLLSACATHQIAVITVGHDHHPNGVLLPHLPHSRALKVMRAQLDMSQPRRKRLWQHIVQRKIRNQAAVLRQQGHERVVRRLTQLAADVRSGDAGQHEAQAARLYFQTLFGNAFNRTQKRVLNASLNYGYSIVRAALARSLVAYGFITAFGLHHRSEQNAFNLADDLLEPFRAIVDGHVLAAFSPETDERKLTREDKAYLVNVLHQDVGLFHDGVRAGRGTVLTAVDSAVISLSQRLGDDDIGLNLPGIDEADP